MLAQQAAQVLARIHSPEGSPSADSKPSEGCLTPLIDKYLKIARENVHENQSAFAEHGVDTDYLNDVEHALTVLKDRIQATCGELQFCHNDYHAGNMLRTKEGGFSVIDYEYAGWNHPEYDIANYFNEIAVDNENIEVRDGLVSEEYKMQFIHDYLTALHGRVPSPKAQEEAFLRTELCEQLSDAYWGLWGTALAGRSEIDWNYHSFAGLRLGRFLEKASKETMA